MNDPTVTRSARIEPRLADMSAQQLQLTALQAIDAAHHAAAEVAEARAVYEGALGEVARLSEENRVLRELLDDLDADMSPIRRAWHGARTAMRAIKGRLNA